MSIKLSHISFVLVLLITVGFSWQTMTIIHFYSNQDQLEADFCINKDKPELNCHAQCHLSKQLKPTVVDNTGSTRTFQLNGILAFQLYQDIQQIEFINDEQISASNFNTLFLLTTGPKSGLLDPPEMS